MYSIIRLLLCIFILLQCSLVYGAAPVLRDAATNTWQALKDAYDAASDGDTVRYPFTGTLDVGTNELQLDKRVMLVGWDRVGTRFAKSSNSSKRIFKFLNVPNTTTNLFGAAHFTMEGGPGSTFGLLSIGNVSSTGKTNRQWRVHHVNATNINSRGFQTLGVSQGLFDNCFTSITNDNQQQGWTIGTASFWEFDVPTDITYDYEPLDNITNFVCIEDSGWSFSHPGDSSVEVYNWHLLMRNNSGTNSGFLGVHENTDSVTPGTKRSATIWSIYSNTWTHTAGQGADNMADFRSGWGIFHHNTAIDIASNSAASGPLLSVYRSSGTNVFVSWYPNIDITGTNRLDGNYNTNVDEYGYPPFEGPGWGDPTQFHGSGGTNSTQTFHGVYGWSNLINGAAMTFKSHIFLPNTHNTNLFGADGTTLADNADLLKINRDWFEDVIKTNWVPLAYPHPYHTDAGISPVNQTVAPLAQVTFTGTAGSGVYLIYEFLTNNSGGTISGSSGVYTAGPNIGVDTVRVLDTQGNYAQTDVTVAGVTVLGSDSGSRNRRRRF